MQGALLREAARKGGFFIARADFGFRANAVAGTLLIINTLHKVSPPKTRGEALRNRLKANTLVATKLFVSLQPPPFVSERS